MGSVDGTQGYVQKHCSGGRSQGTIVFQSAQERDRRSIVAIVNDQLLYSIYLLNVMRMAYVISSSLLGNTAT
jgi:hypothetical protein